MDVSFKMVHGDKGDVLRVGEGLGVGNADQKRTCESGAGSDGDRVQIGKGDVGLNEGGAHYGDDSAEMFAAGQLGDNSAIAGVGGDLGSDGRGESAGTALDHRGGGFVAG